MKKSYWKAVYYTGSRWDLYGEKVVDRECDHKHRTENSAWRCAENHPDEYNGVKEYEGK